MAGGASCAARLRRLDESVEVVIFDRGPYVAFANCGLPYYIGDVIADERKLLVASPEMFRERFNICVHTNTDVTGIDRSARTISVRDLNTGDSRTERYDALVLSPGAAPMRPPLPGVDLPGVFAVRNIPDSRRIRSWIADRHAKTAVIVGGGFIGLEMVENLIHRGLSVTVLEKLPQVMAPLDPEVAAALMEHLIAKDVQLHLGDGLVRIDEGSGGRLIVVAESGASFPSDLVILATGVRPENDLAKATGLQIGSRGGIVVDSQMCTSDPEIWAVGDVVEVPDVLTGQDTVLPLAGPANRQGRVAAESIAGRPTNFRGIQATAVAGVLGLTVASTGASEKGWRRAGVTSFEKVYLDPGHHAGYYPDAHPIHLKLLFSVPDGPHTRCASDWTGRRGQAYRCDRDRDSISRHRTRSGRSRAMLCPAVRCSERPDQPRRYAGRECSEWRHAPGRLAAIGSHRRVAGRRPRGWRIYRWAHPKRNQFAALSDARPPCQTAGKSGNLDLLPCWTAGVLRHPVPGAAPTNRCPLNRHGLLAMSFVCVSLSLIIRATNQRHQR